MSLFPDYHHSIVEMAAATAIAATSTAATWHCSNICNCCKQITLFADQSTTDNCPKKSQFNCWTPLPAIPFPFGPFSLIDTTATACFFTVTPSSWGRQGAFGGRGAWQVQNRVWHCVDFIALFFLFFSLCADDFWCVHQAITTATATKLRGEQQGFGISFQQ